MSRSYKKTPVHKSQNCKRTDKRLASKSVRNCKEVSNGKWYRKLYCTWNINDFIDYHSWDDEINKQSNTNVFWGVGRYIHYLNSIRDKNYNYDEWKKDRPNRNEWEKWYRRK